MKSLIWTMIIFMGTILVMIVAVSLYRGVINSTSWTALNTTSFNTGFMQLWPVVLPLGAGFAMVFWLATREEDNDE